MLNETLTCGGRVARRAHHHTVCPPVGGTRDVGSVGARAERSDPIEERAPKVVPPTPPVGRSPTAPIAPPSERGGGGGGEALVTRRECAVAAKHEGFRLLPGLFPYQQQRSESVEVRRLLLAPPSAGNSSGTPHTMSERKRKERGASGASGPGGSQREGGGSVTCCGATFGATMGNIVKYLERNNQRKGERARLVRAVGAHLAAADALLQTMWGEDANHLGRGTGLYRIVVAQRSELPELASMQRMRADAPGGHHLGTAVGTTASLIALFSCMCEETLQCVHIAADESFIKAMRCAEAALMAWTTPTLCLRSSHWRALEAERRALERALDAAREACRHAADVSANPQLKMALELGWAMQAAFPANRCVDFTTQPKLRQCVRDRSLFALDVAPLSAVQRLPGESGIRGSDDGSTDDRASQATSSSWQTLGSAPSPAFSIGSAGSDASRASSLESLERELARPLDRGMVLSD